MRDKTPILPWCGGAFLQGGGSVGSIGKGTLRGHDQWEGDTGFTGALAVGVGHWHGVDASTWEEGRAHTCNKRFVHLRTAYKVDQDCCSIVLKCECLRYAGVLFHTFQYYYQEKLSQTSVQSQHKIGTLGTWNKLDFSSAWTLWFWLYVVFLAAPLKFFFFFP